MRTALLLAALALPGAQGERPNLPVPVQRALEQLGVDSLESTASALGREPDAATASALAAVALHLSHSGGLEASVPLFSDVLRMRKLLFGAADSGTLFAVNELSRVLLLLGRHGEAIELVEAHLFEIEGVAGVDPVFLQSVLSNHALNLKEWGELDQAIDCMQLALDLIAESSGFDSPEFARHLLNLASLQGDLGRWSESIALARQGLELRQKLHADDSVEVARGLRILGMLLRKSGSLLEAESALRRAEAVQRALSPRDDYELGMVLIELGAVELAKGDGAASSNAFLEGRDLLAELLGPTHPRLADAEVGLATSYITLNEPRPARVILERVIPLLVELYGTTHWITCQARSKLALVENLEGNRDVAIRSLRSVADEVEAPQPDFIVRLRVQLAAFLLDAGELGSAERELVAALGEIEAQFGSDSALAVEPYLQLARIHELRGDLETAESKAAKGLELAHVHGGRVLGGELSHSHYAAHLGLLDLARVTARLRLARGMPEAALDALELGRNLRQRTPVTLAPECEGLLAAEEEARARLRALELRQSALRSRGEELDETQARALAEARNALAARTVEFSRCGTPEPATFVSAARVRAALEEGEVLLAFVWTDERVAWVTLRPGPAEVAVQHGVCASDAAQVAALARGLAEHARALASDPRSRASKLPEIPKVLRELPAASGIDSARRVFYVPDGPLGSLPLEGLLGDGPRPDVAALSTLARVLELDRLREPLEERGRAVVLGDPDFGAGGIALARGQGRLERLPAARAEARYVASLWEAAGGAVELMTGAEATRARLEEGSAGASLLHLATHGFPGSERAPFDAALALAAEPADGTGDWVDALTLERVLRRWEDRLDGCELVVLSACETNREVAVGTGLYSLAGGFMRAGAEAVLASLWRVDESATALLMGRFAENLTGGRPDLPDGGPPLAADAALREAKAWLAGASRDEVREAARRMGLEREADATRGAASEPALRIDTSLLRPYADPYYWSGFVLLR